MQQTIKLLPTFLLLLLIAGSLNGCSPDRMVSLLNIDTGEPKELYFENGHAKIQYAPVLWKEINMKMKDNAYAPAVQIRTEEKAVAIGAGRMKSDKSETEYIAEFKEFMQSNSIDGQVEEDTLGEHTLLTFTKNEGNSDITYSVLVVKDGNAFYEVTFACYKDLYPKYKVAALEVMKTFQVVVEEGFIRVGKPGYGYVNVPQDFINFRDLDDKSGKLFQKANRDKSCIVTLCPVDKKVSFNEFAAGLLQFMAQNGPSPVMYDTTINGVPAMVYFQYYENEDLYVRTTILNEPEAYKAISVEYNGDQDNLYKIIMNSYKPDK